MVFRLSMLESWPLTQDASRKKVRKMAGFIFKKYEPQLDYPAKTLF
jgi:hypothetical protein